MPLLLDKFVLLANDRNSVDDLSIFEKLPIEIFQDAHIER